MTGGLEVVKKVEICRDHQWSKVMVDEIHIDNMVCN